MAEKHPRVSVVIDNHNYGRFLPEAIDSVLAQDFPAGEVVDSAFHVRVARIMAAEDEGVVLPVAVGRDQLVDGYGLPQRRRRAESRRRRKGQGRQEIDGYILGRHT